VENTRRPVWQRSLSISISYGSTETSSAIPSWKLRKAFSREDKEQLECSNPGISLNEFSEKIIAIASNDIPKSKFCVRRNNTVWFNDTCQEAIKKRKKALRKVKFSPTSENIQQYQIIRGQTKKNNKNYKTSVMAKFCFIYK